MARVYAVHRKDIPGGTEYVLMVSGKKRRHPGKTIVIMDGQVNDAKAQVAAYEAALKAAETS